MGHRAAPEGPAPDSDKAYPASVRPARLDTDLWSKLHIPLAQILYRGIAFKPGLIPFHQSAQYVRSLIELDKWGVTT